MNLFAITTVLYCEITSILYEYMYNCASCVI